MRAKVTLELLKQLPPKDKPYDVWDTVTKGLIIRVNKTGKLVYMCLYGRGKRIMVGKVGTTPLSIAREQTESIIANAIIGVQPSKERNLTRQAPKYDCLTFNEFIQGHYAPWVIKHNQAGKETVTSLINRFCKDKVLGSAPLNELTLLMIETWRTNVLQCLFL